MGVKGWWQRSVDKQKYDEGHNRIFKCHHRWAKVNISQEKCLKCGETRFQPVMTGTANKSMEPEDDR